jgi:hypothetical protein
VQKLGGQLASLREEYNTLRREVQEFDKLHADAIEKYSRYKELAKIDDFLDGKITHYLFLDRWGKAAIVEKSKTVGEYTSGKKLRLLSLIGRTDGSLQWEINMYSDGTGSWSRVIPCMSAKEALAELRAHINSKLGDEPRKSLVETADLYEIEIPASYRKAVMVKATENLKKLLDRRRKEVAECEATLAGMEDR